MDSYRINLPADGIPRKWYNVVADVPDAMTPPLHPGTKQPAGP